MANDDARDFVTSLERRGGAWHWRYGVVGDDWLLDLNHLPGMTEMEAEEIVRTAFSMRDAIRRVLLAREPTIH